MRSKFRGVTFDHRTGKWKAQVLVAGKNRNLGYFETAEGAARMWDSIRVRLADYFDKPMRADSSSTVSLLFFVFKKQTTININLLVSLKWSAPSALFKKGVYTF
jgi:hypothetical protein